MLKYREQTYMKVPDLWFCPGCVSKLKSSDVLIWLEENPRVPVIVQSAKKISNEIVKKLIVALLLILIIYLIDKSEIRAI